MNNKGLIYEQQAEKLLIQKGYKIKAKNWAIARLGEIDIIAEKDNVTVFVEVRARSNTAFGSGAESITAAKCSRIVKTAAAYIKRFAPQTDFRFDVISIKPGQEPEHIAAAFTADGFTL